MSTTSTSHDVVVVGARCAGAATAMLLARAGWDVLLVDRATFPSDTASTHAFVRGGAVQLQRWGLLDDLLATGAPAVRSVGFHSYDAGVATTRSLPLKHRAGVDLVVAPRRTVLDALLVDAAVAAGVTLRTGVTVDGLVGDAEADGRPRVGGVVMTDRVGRRSRARARLVVGADGLRGRTAALVGARPGPAYRPTGALFHTYVGGVDWDGYEFHAAEQAFGGVFPTHGGEACVWLALPEDAAGGLLRAGRDRLAPWRRHLAATLPGLADRIEPGTVTAPLRGAVRLPQHLRQASGPGWALVGDAGYHRDPISGHGMTDAFRDADLLATAVDRWLGGELGEGEALASYCAGRDAAVEQVFALTRALGAFPPLARFVDLQTRLSRALDAEALDLAERPLPAALAAG
jgi:2-polyprenyl-6-methoxyphenol hydroxylase-like FAD-dependent oxidoreductase